MNIEDKKVLVIGLGRSGLEAAGLARAKGAEVFVTESGCDEDIKERTSLLEKKGIKVETGGHSQRFLEGIELAVISPGVDLDAPFVREKILKQGIHIISEIELAFNFCRTDKIIAVTGTNGKSTTVELITHILKEAQEKVILCGNIGKPFSACVEEIDEASIVVLEISSYQLETIAEFRPYVSVILNITEDHLDRHTSMYDYTLAKMSIFKNQSKRDLCVINLDDKNSTDFIPSIKAEIKLFSQLDKRADCFLDGENIILRKKGKDVPICGLKDLPFYGAHNVENTLASILAASAFVRDFSVFQRAISSFRPLEHRMQLIASIGGVEFIDDSKATNVDAVKKAVEAVTKDIILICGGRNKGNDFTKMKDLPPNKIKLAIAMGECREEIADAFQGLIKTELVDNLPKAIGLAFKEAERGDCVLLSPMCASFDMFRDYKERGDCFRNLVLKLKEEVRCAQKE